MNIHCMTGLKRLAPSHKIRCNATTGKQLPSVPQLVFNIQFPALSDVFVQAINMQSKLE